MSIIASDNFKIVIGLGKTGLACARYLAKRNENFAVVDSRENPPGAEALKALDPNIRLYCGPFDGDFLSTASELVLSPGVAKSEPAIQQAVAAGVPLCGDIDLFCREVSAPIIAITGSNAKSTVTELVGEMARAAGLNVGVCGNIGTPVLDMLDEGEKDLYVMELSSFQLETTSDLRPEVATVLNISPDHLDRYDSLQDYYQAKHRIFRGAKHVVVNKDDALTAPLLPKHVTLSYYHLGKPDRQLFGVIEHNGELYLGLGLDALLPASKLKMRGRHNIANALAALALGQAAGLPFDAMLSTLASFAGLDHRCQWVTDKKGVSFFNDSKGTNVGATVAALNGLGATLGADNKIILIAGGVGKGAEFGDLKAPVNDYCRALVLIGQDGNAIGESCAPTVNTFATTMDDAVKQAFEIAAPGDIVLLSPACASFDMFSGFPERGDKFVEAVKAL